MLTNTYIQFIHRVLGYKQRNSPLYPRTNGNAGNASNVKHVMSMEMM